MYWIGRFQLSLLLRRGGVGFIDINAECVHVVRKYYVK